MPVTASSETATKSDVRPFAIDVAWAVWAQPQTFAEKVRAPFRSLR
ncbi:hypothetical protein [Amycolatopsis sp. FDAARGOS 1241]|nr:hypothetical protein [Amycolatopsis sp. FDAARGOS 1241]QRP50383.1 hypothetical protein I6J71_23440 [Amycolatopsis sp. FDAARGOS 1241]